MSNLSEELERLPSGPGSDLSDTVTLLRKIALDQEARLERLENDRRDDVRAEE
jgi:hypothetical protein